MKIVEPKYEILTDISEGGIKELQQIERVARVCYKSEDKITPDGESAKKLVGFLVKQGHEAMLEHSQLSVLFTCDRGVANELVRHRIASFAQESTRYCNYSTEKFGGELSFIRPYYIDVTDTDKNGEITNNTPGSLWVDSCECAEIIYKDMIALGIHHLNPITKEDVIRHSDKLLDPENAICVSAATHKAIHYGTVKKPQLLDGERKPGDTCPWRK